MTNSKHTQLCVVEIQAACMNGSNDDSFDENTDENTTRNGNDTESEDSDIDVTSHGPRTAKRNLDINNCAGDENSDGRFDFNFDKIEIIDTVFVDSNRLAILCQLYKRIKIQEKLSQSNNEPKLPRKRLLSKTESEKGKKKEKEKEKERMSFVDNVSKRTCLLTINNIFNTLEFNDCQDDDISFDYETSLSELSFDEARDVQEINILNSQIIQIQLLPNDCKAYKLKVCKDRKLAAVGCTYTNSNNNNNNNDNNDNRYNRLIILDIGNGVDYLDFISDSDSDDDESDNDSNDSNGSNENNSDNDSRISNGKSDSDNKQNHGNEEMLEID